MFAFFAGWGHNAIPGTAPGAGPYLWIPIVGPLVGALAYDFFIGDVLRARETLTEVR
ncbi:hypothetical protein [Amycolatopsis sp.]|uniref:hypothetical protein n=1 Tax=Amycolatopsis sp. TaxID=37632 RepID=UPI002CF381C4|nr:hypothetical protein [Amycolatopsis sp.]HVV09419.1 hypothetical protein [Amycolatopsis sp.]